MRSNTFLENNKNKYQAIQIISSFFFSIELLAIIKVEVHFVAAKHMLNYEKHCFGKNKLLFSFIFHTMSVETTFQTIFPFTLFFLTNDTQRIIFLLQDN